MSKGSKIVPVRIPEVLIHEIQEAIASADVYRFDQPYTVSEWIRGAVAERLGHLRRARTQRKKPKKGGANAV
jgi:hypothetical protein